MGFLQDKLGKQNGGRILDVATSQGGFVKELTETFGNFEEAIGVDIDQTRLDQAVEAVGGEKVSFQKMDGAKLAFEDNSFDTVAMRHSLHHVDQPAAVLAEMMRVLKPGGLFVFDEVLQDRATEQPNSQRHIHHWWGAVDRARGVPHNETFTREEILKFVNVLDLDGMEVMENFEEPDPEEEKKFIEEMIGTVDPYIEKFLTAPEHRELAERGLELKKILRETGCSWEKELFVVGRKK